MLRTANATSCANAQRRAAQQSTVRTNAQQDVGTRRNVEGDTKLLAQVSVANLVGDQPLAT